MLVGLIVTLTGTLETSARTNKEEPNRKERNERKLLG